MRKSLLLVTLLLGAAVILHAQTKVSLALKTRGAASSVGWYAPVQLQLGTVSPLAANKLPPALKSPRYGLLRFGASGSPGPAAIRVVVDEPEGGVSRLFVDTNGDGDLGFLKGLSDNGTAPRLDPADSATIDYNRAKSLFLAGTAAMLVNGDWDYLDLATQMGTNLGVAVLPTVSGAGVPSPFTSSKAIGFSSTLTGAVLNAARQFAFLATSQANQVTMATSTYRLPGLNTAAADSGVQALLGASVAQYAAGMPMPINREMQPVWDALQAHYVAFWAATETAAQAAAGMQADAVSGIAALP